jgi:hypothetical protein
MRTVVQAASLSVLAFVFSACTSVRECSQENTYRIEYSTGGGFTGLEHGMTIECTGWVKFWEKRLNADRANTDSLILTSSTLRKLDAFMSDPAVFGYSMKEAGNVTTTLSVSKAGKLNVVSYGASRPPTDLPASMRGILTEINTLHK